ncbi:MAG: hypothetical protein L0Y67_08825 [Gammaproteobacteria bacterium]|nr:hypothetical protein [Gammaproteobacteria bacterium]MCI0591674.1 hypothetical protein [Gammaproteobacteria bacterium]
MSFEQASEAPLSPKFVIAQAWRDLEESASASLAISSYTSSADLDVALESANVLDTEKLKLFSELRNLRNTAVHVPEHAISSGTAINYAKAAQKLAANFVLRAKPH